MISEHPSATEDRILAEVCRTTGRASDPSEQVLEEVLEGGES